MKLIIPQDKLKRYLNLTERIIGRHLTLPILNNVLLNAEKNSLKISVTDLEVALNIWIPVKIENEGSLTIPAKLFSNFINQIPNQKLILEKKDNDLIIQTENYSSIIKGLSDKDFPLMPKIQTANFFELTNADLIKTLSQILNSAAVSETRPEISGVFFNFSNNLKLVTTDGFRLSEKTFIDILQKKFSSFILPLKAAQELLKILELAEESKIKIFPENNQVLFNLGNIHLISRLIESDYPNYEPIIPKNHQTRLVLNREEFIDRIRVASLFSSKINDVKLKTNLKDNQLKIISQSDYGENNSYLDVKIEGEELEIIFNYRYLLDGLMSIIDKEIIFEFQGSLNPALMRSKTDPNYLYVVMPLRT